MGPSHIYISGPMRAYDGFNFPAFFLAEEVLRGWFPDADICNPAREDVVRFNLREMLDEDPTGLTAGRWLKEKAHFGEAELRDALGRDLAYITAHCDLLVLLPGWEDSSGANAEKAAAEAIGCQVTRLNAWNGESGVGGAVSPAIPLTTPSPTETPCEAPGRHSASPGPLPGPAVPGEHDEVRYTSASGGQKGEKLAAFDQVSPEVEWLVAEHFGKGARKYDAHNFRKGYPWSKSYSALRRHLADFWAGKEYDVCDEFCARPEPRGESEHGPTCFNHTGSLHIVAVIWHAMVLTEFYLHKKEYDDRYAY